ncbi:MAG: hypothetical protein NTU88_10245 [Armatimonadetes bacterium]|nr:hypothetical protein [Armatimonadota bacterium]
MSDDSRNDLPLVLDVSNGQYTVTLYDDLATPHLPVASEALAERLDVLFTRLRDKAPTPEQAGQMLFDWTFPKGSPLRTMFLAVCERVASRGSSLCLWMFLPPKVFTYPEWWKLETKAAVSWEGFYVSEWAVEAERPPGVESPFLVLNPWFRMTRAVVGSKSGRLTVGGRANVLTVCSNPAPGSGGGHQHLDYLDAAGTGGMLGRVHNAFVSHQMVGWVTTRRNPSKAELSSFMADHAPHIFVYLGHGYAEPFGSGVFLRCDGRADLEPVSGMRAFQNEPSELEEVLSGRWTAQGVLRPTSEGLRPEQLPRLCMILACEAAAAAPGLLESGVPAVLAMRRPIPDSAETEEMIAKCADLVTDESLSILEAIARLRRFLYKKDQSCVGLRGHPGLHFSVPVLYLSPG